MLSCNNKKNLKNDFKDIDFKCFDNPCNPITIVLHVTRIDIEIDTNSNIAVSNQCPDEDDFMCMSDGQSACFPNNWKCDGEPDCDGNVDEHGCRKY